MKKLFSEIVEGIQLKENLIQLKTLIKDEEKKAECKTLIEGKEPLFLSFLEHEEPKVRRAAAKVLGEMQLQEALEPIFHVYLKEETLFVKKDYLTAIAELNYESLLPALKDRYEELLKEQVEETKQVHVAEEMQQIQKMIVAFEGIKKHRFTGIKRSCEVLLTTKKALKDVTLNALSCPKKPVPAGVMAKVSTEDVFRNVRTFEEALVRVMPGQQYPNRPEEIGEMLGKSQLVSFLEECHEGEAPFYFRIQVEGMMSVEQRSSFTKKLARKLEQVTEGKLINSTSGYELEIRLLQGKDDMWNAFVKLYTMPDYRFAYRKEHVSASIKPYLAANLMELAKPYLDPEAQVLDPFCGVGTMLIERRMVMNTADAYGLDIFGEAIEKARVNSKEVGPNIHYINRDFADFKHDYKFDEIVTNMPTKSKNLSHKDVDGLYNLLFKRGEQLLAKGGIMVVYGNEKSTMKKCLRIFRRYKLLREFEIDYKTENWLFVIQYCGE